MSEPRVYSVIAVALDISRAPEGFIQVIEKTAYDELKALFKRVVDKVDECHDCINCSGDTELIRAVEKELDSKPKSGGDK